MLLISLSWLDALGFVLIGIGVVGLIWSQRRSRHSRCAVASDTDSSWAGTGCGCTVASTTA